MKLLFCKYGVSTSDVRSNFVCVYNCLCFCGCAWLYACVLVYVCMCLVRVTVFILPINYFRLIVLLFYSVYNTFAMAICFASYGNEKRWNLRPSKHIVSKHSIKIFWGQIYTNILEGFSTIYKLLSCRSVSLYTNDTHLYTHIHTHTHTHIHTHTHTHIYISLFLSYLKNKRS